MKESLQANKAPFNQLAKRELLAQKLPYDPSLLYCLQAAKQALKAGEVKALNRSLPQHLDNLEGQPQEQAWQWLENDHDLQSDLPENPELSDLAEATLEQLHSRLSATLPGYPKPNELPANFR
jgi:hypothetical protein